MLLTFVMFFLMFLLLLFIEIHSVANHNDGWVVCMTLIVFKDAERICVCGE